MAGGRKRDWIREKVAAGRSGAPRWSRRFRAVSAAVRHRKRLGGVDVTQIFHENVVFNLLWVIESVVVLAKLCFFFLRFGFRL